MVRIARHVDFNSCMGVTTHPAGATVMFTLCTPCAYGRLEEVEAAIRQVLAQPPPKNVSR